MKPINDDKSILIFLHIPKTAGETLREKMKKVYSVSNVYVIDISEDINTYKQFSKSEKLQYKIIMGHFHYGFHKYLPSNSFKYITILRNPIERVLSYYYYVLRTPEHYLYKRVKSKKMSLEEFVSSGISTELDNGQTRLICGENYDDVRYGECDTLMIKKAKENLKKFLAVGIQEKFNESLKLFAQILGWNITCDKYDNFNKATNRCTIEETPINTLKIIEKYNLLDIELYNYALEIHNNLLKKNNII